ncbi:Alr7249 protein, partial [Deinococcus aerius]
MLRPMPIPVIPDATARVARAAFPKGTLCMRLRDTFDALYRDEDFAGLYPNTGHPGVPPWRLALVTVFQFLEHLSDRQAAEQVRGRIDWKYALSLELDDPGFNFSVLCEFRARLIAGGQEQLLLDRLLTCFREQGLLKLRGRQRTDSTHVLSCARKLSRLESVGETLRAALNAIATVAPEWLSWCPEGWFSRYGPRVEMARMPKGQEEGRAYASEVGQDGFLLLERLDTAGPEEVRSLPAVEVLRRMWTLQFVRDESGVRLQAGRTENVRDRFNSPYDPEALYAAKGGMGWYGYRVHLTEVCDVDAPHIITNVTTTEAALTDYEAIDDIHHALAAREVLPGEHLMDGGYVSGDLMIRAKARHGVEVIGPTRRNPSWQARTGGYDVSAFEIDWE